VTAEAAYRTAVMDVRSLGRDALTQAERRWAETLGLSPSDGVVMAEIRPGRRSLADLARALETCGTPPAQIRESVDRLVEKGLVEPLPLPGATVPSPA
jgi:DNA-binding IclR family transcriptional regulator